MRTLTAASAALALLAGAARSLQDPPPAPPLSPQTEIARLEQWPAPEKGQRDQIEFELERLRKARTPEMGELGRAGLLAIGDASGPALLHALDKERDDQARARVAEVLTAVTGPQHTRLLAREFESKSAQVRLFCLRRASAFGDAGIRADAEKALARARAGKPAPVAEEVHAAALAVTSSGSLEGLDTLLDSARGSWAKLGPDIRQAVQAVRGPEATARIAARLEGADRDRTVAGLNLLAGCGDRESAPPLVKPYLDSEDNGVRIAAINALRGIVDGEPPLVGISVFEAVELARKWKARR